jgi:hypothetical protein
MQFLFIIAAGVLVAPIVFGIVKSVLEILMKISVSGTETTGLVAQFDFLFKAYLIVETTLIILSSMQVREGNLSKSILWIPFGIIATYVIYVAVSTLFLSMLGV